MKKKILILPVLVMMLSSCSFTNPTTNYAYLNYKYVLNDAGDLHGSDPTKGNVMRHTAGYTSYTSYFDKKTSYINFQCKGTNINDYHCETTFCLRDKDGNVVFGSDDYVFNTGITTRGYHATVIFYNKVDEEKIGTIYVYTPYWVRWQFECDANGDGTKELLTFEFWKNTFNDVPEWSK